MDLRSEEVVFAQTPRTTTATLRSLADSMGMILLPFEYLNAESYVGESYTTRMAIRTFEDNARKVGMNAYVLCPLRHYSVVNHIKAKNPNKDIYAGQFSAQFDVLSMVMPSMIMMEDRLADAEASIKGMKANIDKLDATTRNLVNGLENLRSRLTKLEETAIREREIRLENEFKISTMEETVSRARRSSSWFMMDDPMLVSVNGSILSDTFAHIGPCWGPEVDELVLQMNKLQIIKGQRAKITAALHSIR